jgi:hypothetical protein
VRGRRGCRRVRGSRRRGIGEQLAERTAARSIGKTLLEAARGLFDRVATSLGIEVPFDAKEVNPRNNSSIITLLQVDSERLLFTGDAGVPALERAWDFAEERGLAGPVDFVQVSHHGSRRNASSASLDRLLGPTGQATNKVAFVSAVANSDSTPRAGS